MGERDGIDDALMAAMERTRAKLRRAVARAARGDDDAHASHGHTRHGDRGSSVTESRQSDDRRSSAEDANA